MLIILMVLLLVTVSIAIAVMRAALIDARQFATDAKALQADRLAEAGLARAVALRGSNAGFSGDDWKVELPDREPGAVTTHIEESAGRVTVESVATYPANGDHRVRSRRRVVLEQATP